MGFYSNKTCIKYQKQKILEVNTFVFLHNEGKTNNNL